MTREDIEGAMQRLTDVQQEMDGGKLPPPSDHIADANKMEATVRNFRTVEATFSKTETVEPVAWMVYTQDGTSAFVTDNPKDFTDTHRALPLYTAPPQRQPLTEDEIDKAWRSVDYRISYDNFRIEVARAIERAHGIGGDN